MLRNFGEEDELLLCPYEKSHQIRLSRMQVHLIRCRRNHSSTEVVNCPFNVTHVINKMELDIHVKICPERKTFEMFRHQDENVSKVLKEDANKDGTDDMNSSKFRVFSDSSYDWDSLPDAPAYNPTKYAETAFVVRNPSGLTRSQRREFRAKEKNRLDEVKK